MYPQYQKNDTTDNSNDNTILDPRDMFGFDIPISDMQDWIRPQPYNWPT